MGFQLFYFTLEFVVSLNWIRWIALKLVFILDLCIGWCLAGSGVDIGYLCRFELLTLSIWNHIRTIYIYKVYV
jgi:hypothetical protein